MRIGRPRRMLVPVAAPAGPLVCRWDLDKTYLRSEFDSIRHLLRTAFERPEDKVEVPGVAELIKVLKESAARRGGTLQTYFISASPSQIGKAIRAKLELDGIPYDGIVFKNQLANLRRGRLRQLREHVGFKVRELLRGRLEASPEARELLFGDDWESDPLIYSLYADVLARRLFPERLAQILRRIRAESMLVDEIVALAARAAGGDPVARIFINLERRTPPGVFQLFGPRVVPTFNYFQTAAVLAADGHLEAADVARVGRALVERAGYSARRLENSLDDLVRRGHVTLVAGDALAVPLRAEGVLPASRPPAPRWRRALERIARVARRQRGRATVAPPAVPPPAALDYDAILARLRPSGRGTVGASLGEAP